MILFGLPISDLTVGVAIWLEALGGIACTAGVGRCAFCVREFLGRTLLRIDFLRPVGFMGDLIPELCRGGLGPVNPFLGRTNDGTIDPVNEGGGGDFCSGIGVGAVFTGGMIFAEVSTTLGCGVVSDAPFPTGGAGSTVGTVGVLAPGSVRLGFGLFLVCARREPRIGLRPREPLRGARPCERIGR